MMAVPVVALSCTQLGYYGQAIRGGAEVLWRRHEIEPLLKRRNDWLSDLERQQLAKVLSIRRFASQELGLPDNKSYRSYARLGRDVVLWNVVAAPRYSIEPELWCFPIAGCVSYRGYFKRRRAERFASKLEERGLDVDIGAVTAYSTLGWFADPVLDTFLFRSDAELAALLFHELAHQRVYAKGDTTFNESFATVVELEGARRWLLSRGQPESIEQLRSEHQEELEFVELVGDYRQRLAAVYAAPTAEIDKEAEKKRLLDELRATYREQAGEEGRYAAWFAEGLNNARLASVAAYFDWVPALDGLLARCASDLECFYDRAEELADLDGAERERQLERSAAGEPIP